MTYGCVIVGCCIIPIIVSIDEGIRVLETALLHYALLLVVAVPMAAIHSAF